MLFSQKRPGHAAHTAACFHSLCRESGELRGTRTRSQVDDKDEFNFLPSAEENNRDVYFKVGLRRPPRRRVRLPMST